MKVTITTPVERTVTIEMTEGEAQSLLIICGYIGGNPTSRRGHFDSLSKALVKAHIEKPLEDDLENGKTHIFFKGPIS